jgi:phosphoserine phosphatase
MEKVTQPIPTNPDQSLRSKALENNWPILELFA